MTIMSVQDIPPTSIILVGQDRRGHWIVEESHGLMGGIFLSRDAAMHFIADERASFPGASIETATTPLSLTVRPAGGPAA